MKKKIIIISAIAIVVIGAIIGAIFGLSSAFAGDKGNKSSDDSSVVSDIESSEVKDNVEIDAPADSDKTDSSADDSDKKGTDAKITVGNAQTKKGSIVKVPVNIENNPGFTAALLNFKYDKSVVKYLGYEKGDVLSDYEFADKDGVLKFLCLENNDVDKDGLLFYIKFEVLKGKAETDVELVIDDVVNYDEQSVKFAAASGKITVE